MYTMTKLDYDQQPDMTWFMVHLKARKPNTNNAVTARDTNTIISS